MADTIVRREKLDNLNQARTLTARIVSSIESRTWSLRDIRKSAKKILELLDAIN